MVIQEKKNCLNCNIKFNSYFDNIKEDWLKL